MKFVYQLDFLFPCFATHFLKTIYINSAVDCFFLNSSQITVFENLDSYQHEAVAEWLGRRA